MLTDGNTLTENTLHCRHFQKPHLYLTILFMTVKKALTREWRTRLEKLFYLSLKLEGDEVNEIEILFKESGNQNIYALEGQKRLGFKNSFTITRKTNSFCIT